MPRFEHLISSWRGARSAIDQLEGTKKALFQIKVRIVLFQFLHKTDLPSKAFCRSNFKYEKEQKHIFSYHSFVCPCRGPYKMVFTLTTRISAELFASNSLFSYSWYTIGTQFWRKLYNQNFYDFHQPKCTLPKLCCITNTRICHFDKAGNNVMAMELTLKWNEMKARISPSAYEISKQFRQF